MIEAITAAFLIGFASSSHCLMMCGGISSALSAGLEENSQHKFLRLCMFHLGRVSSYAVLGLVLGSAFAGIAKLGQSAAEIMRLFAAIMILFSGLYIAGLNPGMKYFERKFSFIWRTLQPLVKPLLGMQNIRQAFALGFLWAFLPCGMIYSTLLWASAQEQSAATSLLMFAFGLGTVPALLFLNASQQRILSVLKHRNSKRIIGALLIAYALFSISQNLPGAHNNHSTNDEGTPVEHHHH